MTTAAMEHSFQGPHGTGPRMVQISTCDAEGRTVSVREFQSASKAESLAIAKRESATFVV